MTLRERVLIAIIGGLLVGLVMRDRADAQTDRALLRALDSVSGGQVPIQTNGTNALKVIGK